MTKFSILFTCGSVTEVRAEKVFILTFFIEFITSERLILKLDRDFVRRVYANDTIIFENNGPILSGGDINNLGGQ